MSGDMEKPGHCGAWPDMGDVGCPGGHGPVEDPLGTRRAVALRVSLESVARAARYRLPEGANYCQAWVDPLTRSVCMVAEHPSFDPVAEFAEPPRVAPDDVSVSQLAADVVAVSLPALLPEGDPLRAAVRNAVGVTLALLGVPFRP